MPKLAITNSDISRCFGTMSELRPHLNKDDFVSTIREMEKGGYQLAYIEENSKVIAVAGYRIARNLHMGKHLYVDDLVTAESCRSRGHGETLLSWLKRLAVKEGCSYLHLDSGTHRERAHKFYFQQDLSITSFHFSLKLKS